MVWYLRYMDADDYDSNAFDFPEHHLCLDNNLVQRQSDMAKFKKFTREQSKAVAHFLQFIEETNRDQEFDLKETKLSYAIKEYWGQFL